MSAESPECRAKHQQTNAGGHTHTHKDTPHSQYTTQFYFEHMHFFLCAIEARMKVARISENILRPDCPRAVCGARGYLFLHVFLSVLLCRARRPYFVKYKAKPPLLISITSLYGYISSADTMAQCRAPLHDAIWIPSRMNVHVRFFFSFLIQTRRDARKQSQTRIRLEQLELCLLTSKLKYLIRYFHFFNAYYLTI